MFESRGDGTPRVLVVEDDADLAELYVHWLEDSYAVEVAHERRAAYWQFHEPVDVALVDRQLPDGSGDELVADISELGFDCRVAMVTGRDPTVDVLTVEFDDYLCKPVSREELLSTVERLVARREFENAVAESSRLATKKALVETHCSADDLADSDEYAALEERLTELRGEIVELADSHPDLPFDSEVGGVACD